MNCNSEEAKKRRNEGAEDNHRWTQMDTDLPEWTSLYGQYCPNGDGDKLESLLERAWFVSGFICVHRG